MAQMICPSCGYDNIPGSDECSECFTSLTLEDIPPEEARNRIERSLMEDRVADLHPVTPISVAADATLAAAIAEMRAAKVGCLLATDDSGKLVGILTERDLLDKVALESVDFAAMTVSEIMTSDLETVEASRPLAHALHVMMVGDLRHLPLVDENGQPVGIISSRDIVSRIAKLVGAG